MAEAKSRRLRTKNNRNMNQHEITNPSESITEAQLSLPSAGDPSEGGSISVKITITMPPISATSGSVRWLMDQKIRAEFVVVEATMGTFRAAKLCVASDAVFVAAENFCFDEDAQDWKPSLGIHDVPVYGYREGWNTPNISVSLTPAARKSVENIADYVRGVFARWLESDGEGLKLTP